MARKKQQTSTQNQIQSKSINLETEELAKLTQEAKQFIKEEKIPMNTTNQNQKFTDQDLQNNALMFKIALEKLTKEQQILDEKTRQFEQELRKFKQEQKELATKEQDLYKRESNAEAGFIAQQIQALAELETQTDKLRQQRENLYQDIAEKYRNLDETITLKYQESEDIRQSLEEQKQQLKIQEENRKIEQKNLETEKKYLQNKEVSLLQKEINLKQQSDQLENKQNEIIRQKTEIESNNNLIADLQKQINQLRQEKENIKQEIQQKYDELEEERNSLVELRKQLTRKQVKLQSEQELLEEDQANLEEKITQKAATKIETLDAKIKYQEDLLTESRRIRDLLQNQLIKRQEADRRFGNKTPDEVLNLLDSLREQKQELEKKLASKPSEFVTEKLAKLEAEQEQWESERFKLKTELQELKRNSTYNKIAVTEVETLRDEKEALEISNSRLKTALEELKNEVGEAIINAQNISAFPECIKLDQDTRLQTETPLENDIFNLKEFAQDLQYRIAESPTDKSKRLYYSLRNIRIFLGGLAMSRLHLLQGISGTGKTSLAIAFSRAVNGGSKLIEVQAGWRDRADLMGYYNAFEKRFYESEFLQAIYEAQCPFYQDKIYLILLDEMNLSRPEQYFADFLSKLEQESPKLTLNTDQKRRFPTLFEDHKTLKIPDNIWFIGTANQDETTLEFADKTYDRSHIMELGRHQNEFEIPELNYRDPLSYQALRNAFKNAQEKYKNQAEKSYQFLNENLANSLERKFKIGWGNRLERQIKDFVPVVIASGGTIGEATDHILATKILRKIKDRYDTSASDLKQLKEELIRFWSELDQTVKPEQSLKIINREINRSSQGAE